MRILCCLNRDLVSSVAINLLLGELAGHEVTVALSERIGPAPGAAADPPQRRELRAAEQTIAIDTVFPLLDRAGFPDDGKRFLTFAELARHRMIPVIALPNPNTAQALAAIGALAPDLILSIRYGAIFKPPVLALPRLGTLNLHAGILPSYRGVIASFRALAHRDAELGCTLHFVADGTIDTGDIVATSRVPVHRDRSLFWHVLSLYPGGIALVAAALRALGAGERLPRTPQNPAAGGYYTYPTAAEWEAFARDGWRAVDTDDLDEVLRRFTPLPA